MKRAWNRHTLLLSRRQLIGSAGQALPQSDFGQPFYGFSFRLGGVSAVEQRGSDAFSTDDRIGMRLKN